MVWIFGFGSLTFDGWETEYECQSRQEAYLQDYQRTFNKKSVVNWGTKLHPGLTLNLEPKVGKICSGVTFEFPNNPVRERTLLDYLREREACLPTKLLVNLKDGRSVKALTYIYAGKNLIEPTMTLSQKVELIQKALGQRGSAVDYVRRNFEGLSAAGFNDPAITELWNALNA